MKKLCPKGLFDFVVAVFGAVSFEDGFIDYVLMGQEVSSKMSDSERCSV